MLEWKEEWAYEGGVTAAGLYHAGSMLSDDSQGDAEDDSLVMLVTDTNEGEYKAYLEKLCGTGFEKVFENHTAAVDCCQLKKEDALLYAYYTRARGEVRVIEDRASTALPEFSDTYEFASPQNTPDSAAACEGGESAEIYQYGLYYDPRNGHSPTTTNCGMFYIIRLSDNRLVMIDGGDCMQCSVEALEGMYRFLRRITGTAEGEKIHIAAWFFTHAHGDHVAACIRLLRTYPESFELQRVMFNFPSYHVRPGDKEALVLKETLREYCPDVKCLKLHNGQTVTLANVRFDVLYAQEDAISSEDMSRFPLGDFNCTSVILKMTTGNGTVLWLGDTNVETEALVAETVPAALWKADVVQVAHHCFNFLSRLYPLIDADYAMLPNSYYGGHTVENLDKLADVLNCLSSPDNIWYEDKTTGFRFQDGAYRVILEEPRIGGEHDGVDLYGVKREIL